MKKHFFIFVLFFVFCNIFAHNIEFINTAKIKNAAKYSDKITFLYDNMPFLSGYIPDELWKAPFSKAEYREKLKDILKILTANPENKNQEYLLLKAYVCEALYHLDEPDSYKAAVQAYTAVDTLKDKDYRYKWFLGKFYATASLPFESIKEFNFVLQKIPRGQLHPAFIGDYAYAEVLASMRKSAIADFTDYHQRIGGGAEENDILKNLKENFIDYDGKSDVEFTQLFNGVQREEGRGFFSRLLGVWLPVSEDFQIQYSGLRNNMSIINLSAAQFSPKVNQNITYTVSVISTMSDFSIKDRFLNSLPNLKKIKLKVPKEYTVYEYSDPQQYAAIGGAHGMIAFVEAPYQPSCETAIEAPQKLPDFSDASGPRYFRLQKEYNRYKGPVLHVIMLDSCNDFYAASVQRYVDLLNNMQIK